ncbi:MAG: chemotaxis protein CheW, partial [bacterium]|nr:chemotaxis protein CheW [bacterium]
GQVLRNIQALRGAVEVHSTDGKGTTITLRLPLTLAIIDGMLLQAGSERYILPTLSMVEALSLTEENVSSISGRSEMIKFRGNLLPMIRLGNVFNIPDAVTDIRKGTAIVVEDGDQRVALFTDTLLGQQQVVIKNLGEAMKDVNGIAGGAILADGRIGLIIDVPGFIIMARG